MKASEVKDFTDEELVQQREESRREMFNLRLQQSSGQLEKPSRIKEVRRNVARMETEMTERRKKEVIES